MSLRNSPELTPELLAAKRRNARLSTGPRTPPGKQNSKLNALKHGAHATLEIQTMLALGEDPQEFEDLKQDLMTTYGPGDALWERQIDDLARLYWRRQRLKRAQQGLMRRALQAVDDWQHRRRREIAGATFDPSQSQALDTAMVDPSDPGARLKMLLSFLGVIREQVKQRIFRIRQASEIKTLYGDDLGWPQARLLSLLHRFYDFFGPGAEERRDPELEEMDVKESGPREPAGEPQYQELLRLLDEEIAHVQEEFEYAEKANEEKAAIERDAALAPVGEVWNTMVRLESALDRSIDRKVRILLALRREYASGNLPSAPSDGGTGMSTADMGRASENDVPSETPQPVGMPEKTKLTERSLNVHENKGREIPERGWNAEANKGSYAFSGVTHV
jgi:hypothetical protein